MGASKGPGAGRLRDPGGHLRIRRGKFGVLMGPWGALTVQGNTWGAVPALTGLSGAAEHDRNRNPSSTGALRGPRSISGLVVQEGSKLARNQGTAPHAAFSGADWLRARTGGRGDQWEAAGPRDFGGCF